MSDATNTVIQRRSDNEADAYLEGFEAGTRWTLDHFVPTRSKKLAADRIEDTLRLIRVTLEATRNGGPT